MLVKNVSNADIVDYNCGFEVEVTLKKGQVVDIADARAAKNFVRLLSPAVEFTTEAPEPKPAPKKPEAGLVKKAKKVLKKK